jgi:hypothetical protein
MVDDASSLSPRRRAWHQLEQNLQLLKDREHQVFLHLNHLATCHYKEHMVCYRTGNASDLAVFVFSEDKSYSPLKSPMLFYSISKTLEHLIGLEFPRPAKLHIMPNHASTPNQPPNGKPPKGFPPPPAWNLNCCPPPPC